MARKFLATVLFVLGFCSLAVAGGHLENENLKNSCNTILMRLMRRTRKSWTRFSPHRFKGSGTARLLATIPGGIHKFRRGQKDWLETLCYR